MARDRNLSYARPHTRPGRAWKTTTTHNDDGVSTGPSRSIRFPVIQQSTRAKEWLAHHYLDSVYKYLVAVVSDHAASHSSLEFESLEGTSAAVIVVDQRPNAGSFACLRSTGTRALANCC